MTSWLFLGGLSTEEHQKGREWLANLVDWGRAVFDSQEKADVGKIALTRLSGLHGTREIRNTHFPA